ncbi:MAG: carboxypeptidase regulatory-like domain-containing protein [Acidobacteria bacterium]|nr:carboxypeptidase regulatory-like domain-containing protein [Acidobacteriota bacterium]
MKAVLYLSAYGSCAVAQTATSQISGVVTDPSGAVIPAAGVTALNEGTGAAMQQTTTGAGVFQFSSIAPGRYTLSVEAAGFKPEKRTGIVIEVRTPVAVNFQLQLGSASEAVTIESAAVTLTTANAALGDVITQQAVDRLPLNGRNPLMLVTLQAGVVQTTGGSINVNGGRSVATNVTIDGIEANESSAPNFTKNLYGLSPENVQEFKVTTSNPDAQEGRNSGANVSIATRSGSNQFHGTVYEFFRNTALNAADFYTNANRIAKQQIHMSQYGFNLGGPIVRNKTFFFGSYGGQHINIAQPISRAFGTVTLYTPAAAAGNFRYFVMNPNQPFSLGSARITGNSPLLVNAQTGDLNPGVRNCGSPTDSNCVASFNIPASDPLRAGLDPVIARQLAGYPAVNNYGAGDGLNTGGYFWNTPFQIRGPNYMGRIDHLFNERNSIFARYIYAESNTLNGDPVNGTPQVLPGLPPLGESFWPAHHFVLSYRRVFSASTVNELTLGFSRITQLFTQGQANPEFPNVPAFRYNVATTPYSNAPLVQRILTTPQIVDNLTVAKGAHIVSTGINIRMYQHNDLRGSAGGLSITPTISLSATTRPPAGFALPAVAGAGGPGISSADSSRLQSAINDLLGIPATLTQRFLGNLRSNTFLPFLSNGQVTMYNEGNRLKQYNFYGQDVWKVRRDFTLTFGARWEVNLPPTEAGGRVYLPDRPIDGSQGPVTFVNRDSWFSRRNLGAIAPRLSMAWNPRAGKTVVRAGYGMAFDTISSLVVTAVASSVPGLVGTCSVTLTATGSTGTPGCGSVPNLRLGQGFPQTLPAPSLQPSAFVSPASQLNSNAPSVGVFSPEMKAPAVHEWNLTIQHQLGKDFLTSAGYVGKRGTRLYRNYNINQISAGAILPSFVAMQQNVGAKCQADGSRCPAGETGRTVPIVAQGIVNSTFVNSAATATDLAQNAAGNFATRVENTTLALHLRPNQQFSTINYLSNSADSYYHSLQTALRKRFSSGLLLGATYTFSKSMDNGSADPGGAAVSISATSAGAPVDISNWRNLRARSDFDRRHVITMNSIYELPFGTGQRFLNRRSRIVNLVVGGWGLNAIGIFQSGEPFSVLSGALTNNGTHQSYAALTGTTLPVPALQDQAGIVGPVLFTSTSGFGLPEPGSNGAGRNLFQGPSFWNVDVSVTKGFHVTEGVRLVFRAEAFNFVNHTNFTTGTLNILSPNFGQTPGAVGTASTRNVIRTGEPGRVLQLALKLSF